MHHSPVWTRKNNNSAYSVGVTLRASIALGSLPGASSAKSIWERPVFQRRKKRFELILEPSRILSGESSVALEL